MIWILLLILSLVLVKIFGFKRSQLNRTEPEMIEQQRRFSPSPQSSRQPAGAPTEIPSPSGVPPAFLDRAQNQWVRFKSKYGQQLVPQFSPQQVLTSIEGRVGRGERSGTQFEPGNEENLKARAREIVQDLSVLMGEEKDWPIQLRETRPGAVSGQVYFQETYQGLLIRPMGLVKVDLGPHGELLGFYSDYVGQIQSVLPAQLSEVEVQRRAQGILSQLNLAEALGSQKLVGQKIVWVSGDRARVAYEFKVAGRVLVVDAQEGHTLQFRDLRHY